MTHSKNLATSDKATFHGMLTAAPEMFELFELIERVAASQAGVLIRGETGTGKELVARAIHRLSSRKDQPFEALNCATLSAEMLASELFGHVRGAFTGAVRDRRGLLRRCSGGTLFLDEIAEMPLNIQAQLLRVIQERRFVPLGASAPVDVDIRILSATHKSLRDEASKGRFREDLMYRVRVVPIYLPPLRARQGDVHVLMWHFIEQLNAQDRRVIDDISESALQALLNYRWPGNVRELRNAVEHAFVVGQGPQLLVQDLPPEFRGEFPHTAPSTHDRAGLIRALKRHGWNRNATASELGLSRTTLWRKMREYNIDNQATN